MNASLNQQHCQPCQEGSPPLKGDALKAWRDKLESGWNIVNEHHLEKEFTFDDFRAALDFTNRVGEIAERENHHPDILLTYGKVGLKLWTHKAGGVTENDFILAAKVDQEEK